MPRWPEKKKEEPKIKRTPVPPAEAAVTPKMERAIDKAVALVRKKFGDDAIYRFNEIGESVIGVFSSGIKEVDDIIGIGGWPLAKLVQISGKESVGKSSWCKWLIGQAQAQGIVCAFIDMELSPDSIERAKAFGVDIDSLLWSETMYLEDAFSIAAALIESFKNSEVPVLIFMDSIAAGDMKSSKDREFDEQGRSGEKAAFLSKNIPKLVHPLKGTKIGIVFVNQMRTNVRAVMFQDPNYEPGGRALAHWCHLTIRMNALGQIKEKGEVVGIKARMRVKKSKLAPPFKQTDIAIYYNGKVKALEDGTADAED
jgi:recombination protein RecA